MKTEFFQDNKESNLFYIVINTSGISLIKVKILQLHVDIEWEANTDIFHKYNSYKRFNGKLSNFHSSFLKNAWRISMEHKK